ncbi:MAG: ribonuclease PH [Thermoleophilia bacterium]|nr:ribonuclease PH [Thermoleophilia bacterium]
MTKAATPQALAPVRPAGRPIDALREVRFTPDFLLNADGSVLIEMGGTRLICTASIESRVPKWMEGNGRGWVTAEYAMLPPSTGGRKARDGRKGRTDGRSVEIQRLIGRSLRAVVDLDALGERSITVDCDAIDADGGTRCAAICGGYVALYRALAPLVDDGTIAAMPLTEIVSAVSVGIIGGEPRLDLEYVEDSRADVDMNLVVTESGQLVEVQASAEGATYSRSELDQMMELALAGCRELSDLQRAACEA